MAQATDLQALREILSDGALHLLLAQVEQVVVAPDKSGCRVMVTVLPEKRALIAQMSWEAVGQSSGFFVLPNVGDLVILGQIEGSADAAFVLKRLSSADEPLPTAALDGSLVAKAGAGLQAWLTSDTRINLSSSDDQPSENVVLGQQLTKFLSKFLQIFEKHTHIDSIGGMTQPPSNATDATALGAQSLDNQSILSKIAFTD
jgi:hypothetical protein